ncbi:hypothetical protein NDU88_001260 [Pleurodeles waltl]|uniref:Uncharacterized protein n=1 Tax=Pleurodeles waltl TaxID=8319 RepID=A0AAV7VVW8_PLEWA|nr:hypothetical protein NDU88_001260 [Pleurodeles waltl]
MLRRPPQSTGACVSEHDSGFFTGLSGVSGSRRPRQGSVAQPRRGGLIPDAILVLRLSGPRHGHRDCFLPPLRHSMVPKGRGTRGDI